VIFRVLEESRDVQILHIRHGARRAFQPKDLK
jgi:plasmid stabilization system protein ParE